MRADLTEIEIKQLAEFRFSKELPTTAADSFDYRELLNEANLLVFVQKLQIELCTPDLQSAASLMMKRMGFLAVGYLYSMTVFNKMLNAAPDNLVMVNSSQNGHWLPKFHFISQESIKSTIENRDKWLAECIRHLFADNLFPVMETITKAAKIPKLILWENLAIYIFWLYEKVLSEMEDVSLRERAANDFDFLLHSAPGSLFGNYHQNPLKRYYSEPKYNEETNTFVRTRKTCCFNFKAQGGEFCTTCPRICR